MQRALSHSNEPSSLSNSKTLYRRRVSRFYRFRLTNCSAAKFLRVYLIYYLIFRKLFLSRWRYFRVSKRSLLFQMKLFSYIRYTYFPFFLYRTFVATMMKNKYFESSFNHTNANQKLTKSRSKHLILYSGFRLNGTPVNQNHRLFGTNTEERKQKLEYNAISIRLYGTYRRFIATAYARIVYSCG